MLAFAASLLVIAQSSPIDPDAVRLTYENPGVRAKNLVLDLSRLARVRLEASADTADETLAVRFPNWSLQEVMDRVAWAVRGSWRHEAGAYRLVRTPEEKKAEARDDLEAFAGFYRRCIERLQSEIKGEPPITAESVPALAAALAEDKRQEKIKFPYGNWDARPNLRAPGERAMAHIAIAMDPEDLARMPKWVRVVYSNHPTRTQRKLTPKLTEAIRQFLREDAIWTSATDPKHAPPSELKYDTVLLALYNCWNAGAMFTISLNFADEHGHIVGGSGFNLFNDKPMFPPTSNRLREKDLGLLPILPDTLNLNGLRGQPIHLSPAAQTALVHLDIQDPIRLGPGGLLVEAARMKNLPLVADLPDATLKTRNWLDPIAPGALLDVLEDPQCERSEATDWIGLRPRFPVFNRQTRVDRDVLAHWMRRFEAGLPLSIEERARFIAEVGDGQRFSIGTALAGVLIPRYILGDADDKFWRFCGLLDDEQWAAAQRDGLRMDALSPQALGALDFAIHEVSADFTFTPASPDSPFQPEATPWHTTIYREPTVALPDGIPPDGVMKIKVVREPVVCSPAQTVKDTRFGVASFVPENLARMFFSKERPDLVSPPKPGGPDRMATLHVGTSDRFEVTLQFTPEIATTFSLFGDRVGEATVFFDQLPEDFRKGAAWWLDYLRKNPPNPTNQPRPGIAATKPPPEKPGL